jgi:Zn2+/Cd2+-exporting ATPase
MEHIEKTKINLDLILPEIPDERDECVKRLLEVMQNHKGIEKAHVVKEDGNKATLCFHYKADSISIDQIRKLAQDAGVKITKRFGHLLINVQGIRDMSQAKAVENDLIKVNGVLSASASVAGIINIEFDQELINKDEVLLVVDKAGLKSGSTKSYSNHKVEHEHKDGDDHEEDEHEHGEEQSGWKAYLPVAISLFLFFTGLALDHLIKPAFFTGLTRFALYAIAYLPVGLPVAIKGFRYILKGDVFTEFILMTLATVGAFYIGEYPEGVAVMLFYTLGELFQDAAVNRAKRSIKALLDIRPDKASVGRGNGYVEVNPDEVKVGETIQIKAGEKVPLDGEMLSENSTFNTAALTGESAPSTINKGETVLAGMINQGKVIELKVSKLFNESSLARILTMVQEATTRKAKTEQFIRRFSRIYTPVVVFLAAAITFIPYFVVDNYSFNEWLYRSLIFLVISCPCALVISIPLGYFGGIGAASKNGILFKGSNFLDLITKVNVVVMDKTGTLTKGVFKVQEVISYDVPEAEWLPIAAAIESNSTHPIAQAVVSHVKEKPAIELQNIEEISGHGLKGTYTGKEVLAGNLKLMEKFGITVDEKIKQVTDTIVVIAIDKKIAGYITIADEIKEDSKQAIEQLHKAGIKTVMLSGDKQAVVDKVAKTLDIDDAFGDLLPEHKVQKVEELKTNKTNIITFVGDGVNDAPVLALSDVGIAMGGFGSDAAIETADVIIQTDQPSKIAMAIAIGKATNRIVWQNIGFAFGVKIIVLILGAGGLATMWEAVFADVGVALLAILNAVRIQKMKF